MKQLAKPRLTSKQRVALKVLRNKGIIYKPAIGMKYRLRDITNSDVQYVHGKTVKALVRKQLIVKKKDNSYAVI